MCGVYKNATFTEIFTKHTYSINESVKDSLPENTIGQKIKKLRYSLNLTQLQFAKSIHRGFGTVTKWEQELTMPKEEAINDIIKTYKLDSDYFKI